MNYEMFSISTDYEEHRARLARSYTAGQASTLSAQNALGNALRRLGGLLTTMGGHLQTVTARQEQRLEWAAVRIEQENRRRYDGI